MNATKDELKSCILRNKTSLALIDTRSPEQMMIQSKIENAVNIPNIPQAMAMAPADFKLKYGVEYPKEGDVICLHCNVGGGSSRALDNLIRNHTDLAKQFIWRNVAGGVRQWNEEKVQDDNKKIKIDL